MHPKKESKKIFFKHFYHVELGITDLELVTNRFIPKEVYLLAQLSLHPSCLECLLEGGPDTLLDSLDLLTFRPTKVQG